MDGIHYVNKNKLWSGSDLTFKNIGNGVKHRKKIEEGIYVADKQNKENTHPKRGKKQVAYLCFLQLLLLQFPGLSGRGRKCCSFNEAFLRLTL